MSATDMNTNTSLMYPNTWQNLFAAFYITSAAVGAFVITDVLRKKGRER